MGELILFAAAVAAGYLAARLRLRSATAAPTADDVALVPRTIDDPSLRLQELSSTLSTIGDASSHPRDLAANPTFREAVALLRWPSVPMRTVLDYAAGANWILATVACAALCERDDLASARDVVVRQFRHLSPWPLYYALEYFTKLSDRPALGALVLQGPPYGSEHPIVPVLFKEHFTSRTNLGDTADFGGVLAQASAEELENAEKLLRKVDHPAAATLLDQLTFWRQRAVNRDFLQSIGRIVQRESEDALLVEYNAFTEQLAALEATVLAAPFRSAVVVGEPRSGKSSLLKLLGHRAAAQGWIVLEAGAASLMAGQVYYGQMEERLRRLETEAAVDKRVIWYVPDFAHLATSGTHQGQTASLLDQVLPAISTGRVVMISETTPAALTSALQRRPALRSAVDLVRLPALNDEQCDRLANDVSARLAALCKLDIAPAVTTAALHLTRHYLGTGQMPGAVLDLLKLTAQRVVAHDARRIDRDDLLASLSQVTGMPKLVLDDSERLELASIRRFFADRVIGQDEAVDAMVDRIAMLKAGVTDPGRPIGVFLFAGPTGTGKTELAKTLAEFLFGSADRLLRLDMSEFQAGESTRKILGDPDQRAGNGQALTDRVRKQPFSVVLLDEFEKAHPNAWDLFLQVFDDGRLTDAMGDTVDFRHCIIILTSNVGSQIQQQPNPGFVSTAGAFSAEHVSRAIHQSFRPEFVNRLDAIIVFRPLTRALMRGILAKELARVLERRGLRHREWAVEWESSALDFLLEKGFSPAMGARPLKRAIDRYLLAPLAATLVEHRFPEGDQFLFVRSDGRSIQVEFVDPDAPDDAAPAAEPAAAPVSQPTVPRMMLHPKGTEEERAALEFELHRVHRALTDSPWCSVEQATLTGMQQQDFWQRPDRFAVLSRYALMDRVKAAVETASALEARLKRSAGSNGRYSRDLISRLATQLYVIQHGIDDAIAASPVEVVLCVQSAVEAGHDAVAATRWCERLLGMYRNWASRRHMQWEEVPGDSPASIAAVVVSGFGAARILSREAGLHVLEYESGDAGPARAVGRVRVAPTPAVVPEEGSARRTALMAALNESPGSATIVRRYKLDSSPLVRDVQSGWRTGRHELVLEGNFDVIGEIGT